MDPEQRPLPASLPMLGLALLVALLFPTLMLRYGGPAAQRPAAEAPPASRAVTALAMAPSPTPPPPAAAPPMPGSRWRTTRTGR